MGKLLGLFLIINLFSSERFGFGFFFFLALIRRGLGREEAAGWVEDRKIPVSRGKGFLLEMALIPMDVEPVSAV